MRKEFRLSVIVAAVIVIVATMVAAFNGWYWSDHTKEVDIEYYKVTGEIRLKHD